MFEPPTELGDAEPNPDYDQIAGAHGLLASYPFASATPTAHVARHLGPLSLTSPIPSLGQLNLYPPPNPMAPDAFLHGNIPVDGPARHAWEQHREAFTRGLQAEAHRIPVTQGPNGHLAPSTSLNSETQWAPSNYQVSPLANSVLRSVAYHHPARPPLPPDLAPVQSSLSNALGIQPAHAPASQQSAEQPPNHVYSTDSSATFFDQFLSSTLKDMGAQGYPSTLGSHTVPRDGSRLSVPDNRPPSYARTSLSPTVVGYSPSPAPSPASTHVPPHLPQPQQYSQQQRRVFPTTQSTPQSRRAQPNPMPQSSPDPLALRPGDSAYLNPVLKTPSRKRKSPSEAGPFGDGEQSGKRINSGRVPYIELPSPASRQEKTANNNHQSGTRGKRGRSVGIESDTTHQDADATAYDYGDGYSSGSEYKHDGLDDVDMAGATPMSNSIGSARRNTGKSVGRVNVGRDDRIPLKKLTEFIEDIFEAEDSLAPDEDTSLSHLPPSFSTFFSSLSDDPSRPLLNTINTVGKLSQLIGQVANPSKRTRRNAMASPVKGQAEMEATRLAELDPAMLGRLLKLLGRSVAVGEDLDPFAGPPASTSVMGAVNDGPASPGKKKGVVAKKSKGSKKKATDPVLRRSSRSRSRSREGEDKAEEDASDMEADGDAADASLTNGAVGEVGEDELERLSRAVQLASESVAAAACAIALLAGDSLPKQLYSEELIMSCMSTIKNQLSKIIYPFAEALSDIHGHNSAILQHTVQSTSAVSASHRKQIGSLFQLLESSFPQITALVQRASPSSISASSLLPSSSGAMISTSYITMSDGIIIQMVYIAIGPFFVVETSPSTSSKIAGNKEKANVVLSALGGVSALRALRLRALSLIRSIFEANPEQRSWIIDEILTSLIKLPDLKQKAGQFRLRDGRSIHTVTALLLQLVQTSSHDTALQARDFSRKRRELAVQYGGPASKQALDRMMADIDLEEMKVYGSALDGAYGIGRTIFAFLTSRAGKGKGTKTTNESEYRAILDTLIADILTVLYWPEWPGAAILLVVATKLLGKSLDDVKTAAAAVVDTNGLRAIALDHLGSIAARLRASQLRNIKSETDDVPGLPPLETIMSAPDNASLEVLIAAHEEIAKYLTKSSVEDVAINESGREMGISIWCQEMAQALTRSEASLSELMDVKPENSAMHADLKKANTRLRTAFRSAWKPPSTDVFTQFESKRADLVSEVISVSQVLKNAFEPILSIILSSLDASAVFMRSKALRALGEVITVDPNILQTGNVRRAIENHLQDSSPAVRDAAVELIGRYIISMPSVANNYYGQIAERIADTGLGVRKRVIKLFKNIYAIEPSVGRKVDICARLVLRMLDEDDTVKDLASKTIGELWFPSDSTPKSTSQATRSTSSGVVANDAFISKVSVIIGVVAKFADHQSPLEDLLHQLAHNTEGESIPYILTQYEEICDALIENLVDGSDSHTSRTVESIKAIHLLTTAYPGVITSAKALTLLPYLKNPSNAEEQLTSDYLLKIFRISIPTLPKSASKFGQELQTILQPMVIKPSTAGGVSALQETVATLCTVVKHLTHTFQPLVGLLKSCNVKLQGLTQESTQGVLPAPKLSSLVLLIYITSLLCEHCDFDELRESDSKYATSLDAITKNRINEHMYSALLTLHAHVEDPVTRSRIMQCLGFLFRAYPALMTQDESAELMDFVFTSPDLDARARLLRIIQDFLMSESSKFMALEKGLSKGKGSKKNVNMEELVGNTIGFADSGVSSAIVQRYFPQILECCVTNHPVVQSSAIDILGFVVRQGLAHPIQCVSAIIALETSPSHSISNKALSYHTVLYNKHATMINARHIESARKSFEYQQRLDRPIVGYRIEPNYSALLNGWYSLVREKRATRQDFLKALVKSLDIDVSPPSLTQSSTDFIRYMTENFAALEYKTQEEVLTVIRHITSVLSVAGFYLIDLLGSTPSREVSSEHLPSATREPLSIEFSRTCTCVSMLLILKGHLKGMYGLSEDKCMKWVPGKKSAVGDKSAVRRHEVPIVWSRVPFATIPILSQADQDEQHNQFQALWDEEGVSPEPVDDVE